MKEKFDKLNFIKITNFALPKTVTVKRQAIDWDKIFTKHIQINNLYSDYTDNFETP